MKESDRDGGRDGEEVSRGEGEIVKKEETKWEKWSQTEADGSRRETKRDGERWREEERGGERRREGGRRRGGGGKSRRLG